MGRICRGKDIKNENERARKTERKREKEVKGRERNRDEDRYMLREKRFKVKENNFNA